MREKKGEIAKRQAAGASTTTRRDGVQDEGRFSHGSFRGGRGSDIGRGRGQGRRAHNSGVGRGGINSVASGPFGDGQASKEARQKKRPVTSSGRSRGGGGGSRGSGERQTEARGASSSHSATPAIPGRASSAVKQEAGLNVQTRHIVDVDGDVPMDNERVLEFQNGDYISSDEDEEEKGIQRMNVEHLGIVDLTQEDPEFDPYAPVRVPRVAHKERSRGINADGATNQDGSIAVDANDIAAVQAAASFSDKKNGKQKPEEVDITGEKEHFQGTYPDSDDDLEPKPHIKPDPDDVDEQRDMSQQALPGSASDMQPREPPSSPEARMKAKDKVKASTQPSRFAAERPDYQTPAELEEWERHQEDLDVLRKELGMPIPTSADANGDATMTDSETEDRRADKVYLFQFPPVLPPLQPANAKTAGDAQNGPPAETNESMQLDNPIPIKHEPSTETSPTQHQPKFPSGAVGKLKVHASGRVTLDWGGTSLCLGMGTEASFLQDLIVANLSDVGGADGASGGGGTATSMGSVRGKFVVTPDWEEILR